LRAFNGAVELRPFGRQDEEGGALVGAGFLERGHGLRAAVQKRIAARAGRARTAEARNRLSCVPLMGRILSNLSLTKNPYCRWETRGFPMRRSLVQAMPNWLSNGLMMLYRGRRAYCNDGILSIHNTDFLRDPRFARAAELGVGTGSFGSNRPIWRIYINCWAASTAKHIDGDFIECGVNRGGNSRAIIDYIDFAQSNKIFWLLDTYNGLVKRQITPAEAARGIAGMDYEDCYDDVVRTFSPFANVKIVRGEVPDYGWAKHEVQKEAFDEFARMRSLEVLTLPTGQGMLIKN
jgi:hypothetical protein